MTTAAEHIRTAARLVTDKQGFSQLAEHRKGEADSHTLIAIAEALTQLAATAKADAHPTPINQTPWPDGVTARILTRIGMRSRDLADATVDIHDTDTRSTARCRPCGWTKDHGIAYRAEVLEWARGHAADCTGLPQPTA